ncbi:hypothetical protein [Leptospira haakeii]|uniref:Uncharacterized protein n=1 Tax=Leptospira haakeii TaxID=2023198 RepID=A0ABX4PK36_9LEPT|nr:hypothetical protein [Leptospira haakeii]PKA16149.1 hypothetical protein CH363_08370 [Leptospira haakeii]PKA18448.1 hypothetical protein CH377_17255 [Leptospira haakeii]
MHFVLSWDIHAANQQVHNKVTEELKLVIKPYAWVRPLNTFYIVKVQGQTQWDSILDGLVKVNNANNKIVNLVMTPLMQGGNYNGLLSKDLWNSINGLTK